MWWFRTLVLAVATLAAGACGFQPLYGSRIAGGGTPAELSQIRIEPIADRTGQQLHNQLLTMLNPDGRPARPRYLMTTKLSESLASLGVRKSAFATRANLELRASYSLKDVSTKVEVFAALSAITVSYDILDSEFATLMAEREARERATRELGQEIRIRLAAFFSGPDARPK